MIKKVKAEKAIGMSLAHDLTRVVPRKFKGAAFRKGHIITEEDIPELLKMGKENIYVVQLDPGEIHEDEAAISIAEAVTGKGLSKVGPREGKINLKSEYKGLVKINVPLLNMINSIGDIIVVTVHNYTLCDSGMEVAGMRVIPLIVHEEKIKKVEELCRQQGKLITVIPMKKKNVAIVAAGSEVFKGRIDDAFTAIVEKKVKNLGSTIIYRTIAPDDINLIAEAINNSVERGAELVLVCGGMSVDPDDVTREGIAKAGADIIFYGVPVLPGAMTLYGKIKGIPIMGVPACVLHDPTTAFDIFLPRVLAGEKISKEDIIMLGHGGFCRHCSECRYPLCAFGKQS
jgi:molybdenum cofactor synthesis domain-containing protein